MKIETKTYTSASSVTLTEKEIEVLESAQMIIDTMLIELGKADRMSDTVERIYNNADDTVSSLDEIMNLVNVEELTKKE